MTKIELGQGLYPFHRNQLDRFEFDRYTLINVFEKINEAQRDACVDLWLRNRALPSEQAARARSEEICYMLTERSTQQVIGVNTLYTGELGSDARKVWLNRMFIDPDHRSTRLMITGTAMMLCFAKTFLAERGCEGVVNVNENRKLSRPGMQRIFQRLGYRRIGWQNGNEVLLFPFAEVEYLES